MDLVKHGVETLVVLLLVDLVPGVGTQAVVVVQLVDLVVHKLEEEEHVVILAAVLLAQHNLVKVHCKTQNLMERSGSEFFFRFLILI